MEDYEIIKLYWARSETAITETAVKYEKYCNSIAYRILMNFEDANECVNDTWFHAWNAIPPHKPTRLSLFLGKITRELSLDRYKMNHAKKRGKGEVPLALDELSECVSGYENVEQCVEFEMLGELISNFLRAQSSETRQIFIRRYWYLHSIGEIAGQFGISESKTKMLLMRTRIKLRAYLESEGIII